MHGFRDNDVLLPTGYDVIVIYPLDGVLYRFCWWSLKEQPSFMIMVHWHISRITYRFEPIRHLFWLVIALSDPIWWCFRVKHPQFYNYTFLIPKGSSLHQTACFELLCVKIASRVWAVALLENKNKITGSPAGLSRVNGVRRSSAETWDFNPSPKVQLFQSIWNLAWVITLGRLPALSNLVWVRWAVETPRGVNIYMYCNFFLFFNKATAHTREPILAHNSSKDAVRCKEDPFGDEKCVILKFGGVST